MLDVQAGLVTLGGKSISLLEYKNDWRKMEQLMVAAAPDFPPGNIDSLVVRFFPLKWHSPIQHLGKSLTFFFPVCSAFLHRRGSVFKSSATWAATFCLRGSKCMLGIFVFP